MMNSFEEAMTALGGEGRPHKPEKLKGAGLVPRAARTVAELSESPRTLMSVFHTSAHARGLLHTAQASLHTRRHCPVTSTATLKQPQLHNSTTKTRWLCRHTASLQQRCTKQQRCTWLLPDQVPAMQAPPWRRAVLQA